MSNILNRPIPTQNRIVAHGLAFGLKKKPKSCHVSCQKEQSVSVTVEGEKGLCVIPFNESFVVSFVLFIQLF